MSQLLVLRVISQPCCNGIGFGAKRTRDPDSWPASASAFLTSRAHGRLANDRGGARLETFLIAAR
jgi:hypothetical protein